MWWGTRFLSLLVRVGSWLRETFRAAAPERSPLDFTPRVEVLEARLMRDAKPIELPLPTPQPAVSGPATILVIDQSEHKAFGYDQAGAELGTQDLAHFNSRPRDITATPDGQTYLVIDASKNVFVYGVGQAGAWVPRGAWRPEGLRRPEGIGTDGVNVWMVEAATDQILFYRGAVGRTSGSQTPDAAFSLAAGNRNPTGLFTDGQTIWVTEDGRREDRVFVYTVAGESLGSWATDSENQDSRGITADAGGAVLIVDRADSLIYRYEGGLERRAGQGESDGTIELSLPVSFAIPRRAPRLIMPPRLKSTQRARTRIIKSIRFLPATATPTTPIMYNFVTTQRTRSLPSSTRFGRKKKC